MSLLYSVVFASRCRSNHHRLAVDALRHLRSPDAEAWRTLLLHHHADYLKGAKAPDEVFKDFKNHVLHVRDGDWGGAADACEEWYRRFVRALKDEEWAQAAWCAGVMSHYYVDPIQPFHTHQTEEEGVIHRAVEQSFSKSYGAFQQIIEHDLGGYPMVETPADQSWLGDMVRAGARLSTPSYELIIDHFDHVAAVKDPPAGLDQELKDAIAKLVAHAAAGLAAILDRGFAEAAVKPPMLSGGLQAFFLALEVPIQFVLSKIEDGAERKLVAAQYEEFRKTGKVRETLGEDDKVVRALYAAEVQKIPLSSLDAKWPREIGTKAGTGAPARESKPAKAAKPPKARQPARGEAKSLKTGPRAVPAPARAATEPSPAREKPPAPAAAPTRENLKFTLTGDAPVVDAPSIGPKTARRLEAVGVKTVADLLALAPATAAVVIDQRHISAQLIQDWQSQALLACTVPNLKSREAQALVACGVRDAQKLIAADPGDLADAIARWTETDAAERAWGAAPPPTEEEIGEWIARARAAKPAAARPAA